MNSIRKIGPLFPEELHRDTVAQQSRSHSWGHKSNVEELSWTGLNRRGSLSSTSIWSLGCEDILAPLPHQGWNAPCPTFARHSFNLWSYTQCPHPYFHGSSSTSSLVLHLVSSWTLHSTCSQPCQNEPRGHGSGPRCPLRSHGHLVHLVFLSFYEAAVSTIEMSPPLKYHEIRTASLKIITET
jgi:hypothetical protein